MNNEIQLSLTSSQFLISLILPCGLFLALVEIILKLRVKFRLFLRENRPNEYICSDILNYIRVMSKFWHLHVYFVAQFMN